MEQLPREDGVTIPGGVQNRGDVALRDVGSGHGGLGLGILEVFSNLGDSMTFKSPSLQVLKRRVDVAGRDVVW